MVYRDRLLSLRVQILSIALLVVLLLLPTSCFAAKAYSPEVEKRLVSYGIQVAELVADLVAVKLWNEQIKELDEEAAKMAKWKHVAYADDHYTAENRLPYVQGTLAGLDYAKELIGKGSYGSDMPGYRPITMGLHSDLYKERVSLWRARMQKMLSDNYSALNDIYYGQARIRNILDDTRNKDTAGYTRRVDEAAFLEALLDDEISKLNADVDRRFALETEIALNEQLERSDDVAAYALAIGAPLQFTAGAGVNY